MTESLNRIILDSLRALTANTYMNPEYANILISPIINMINSLTFKNKKMLSPYLLMFAQKPEIDILTYF